MPRDFLDEDYVAPKSSQPRDFLMDDQEESLGEAAKLAPFRVGEDLLNAGYQGIQNIPEYWEKAKTEVPALLNPLSGLSHPASRIKNAIAGLAELGHGVLNAPHGISNYLENRLNLLPKGFTQKIPHQEDISEALNQFTGNEMNPGDALTRGLIRNLPQIIPAGKTTTVLNPLNLTAKNIAKDVLNTRERNIQKYGTQYENLWNEAANKGFTNALYNIDIDIPTISKYTPTKSIKGVLDFDKDPTIGNAHAAKSDLLRIERELDKKTTLSVAERQQLKAVKEGIKSIKDNMFKEANGDLNESLFNKYNQIQEGYRNEVVPYKNKAIGEYLRGESSPEELVNALSRKAFYAKRGKYHKALKLRKGIKSHPYLSGLAAGGVLGTAGNALYGELFGK